MKNKNIQITRRALLKATSVASGGFFAPALLPTFAHAAERNPDRYFIFAYFSGGWDLLLGLDPRDPTEFTENRLGATAIQPGYERLAPYNFNTQLVTGVAAPGQSGLILGPAAQALAPIANQLCIFNGINMETLAHEVGYRYFLTGQTPAGLQARGSSVAAQVTAQLGASVPVPNLAHTEETYSEGLPGFAGAVRINKLSDLLLALKPSATTLPAAAEAALRLREQVPVACAPEVYNSAGLLTAYRQSRKSARDMVSSGLSDLFNFGAPTPEMSALRARFGITYDLDSPAAQAALATRAITSGVSQVVSVRLAVGLDTHFNDWATNHSRQLSTGFSALAKMIQELQSTPHPKGGTYLDKTVVCAFSEFGRTPLLNDRGGRDHFLGNSCLLAGGGIKKGVTFGESSNYAMAPRLISHTTGKPLSTGKSLHPENILATAMAAAGLNYSQLRADPIADAIEH
jgi:uncharacterized protein (DUF1501 family)